MNGQSVDQSKKKKTVKETEKRKQFRKKGG